jgi:hypothetical protein
MRFARLLLSFVLVLSFLIPSAAQTTSPQAVQYLQRALAALSGSTPTTDVTLTGSAHYIAGSDDETGTATLKAIMGASRMDLNLSSGPRSEVWNSSPNQPVGAWSGADGVSHPISNHNLLTEPAWFFPAFLIAHGLSGVATYVGHETKDMTAVENLTINQTFSTLSAGTGAIFQHLSQVHLYLDSSTFLPFAISFNIHPDKNALLDIPIEIRFSDYRSVSGVQIPFHVQKFLNNGLILDLQFTTAVLNTGLAASQFQVGE